MSQRRNRWLFAGLPLLAAAALLVWWQQEPAAAPRWTAPETAASEKAAAPAKAAPEAGAPAPRVQAPAAATAPAEQPAATLARLRGRCVAAEDGRPLAGCRVEFGGSPPRAEPAKPSEAATWHDPEPQVTGADGWFEFAFVPPERFSFDLGVTADSRLLRLACWKQLTPGEEIDLGDIPLQHGFALRGRIVDERGVPVPRLAVCIDNLPMGLRPGMWASTSRHGFSDAAGGFEFDAQIPAGTWLLGLESQQHRLVSPEQVVVDPIHGADPLLVVVRAMPTIEGIVVDEHGVPVPGVSLGVEISRSGRIAMTSSRADGRFVLHAVDADPQPVRLVIHDPGPCEPSWQSDRFWEWGTRDLRIQLRRTLSFELSVVARDTGAPVAAYAVVCYHERANSSLQKDPRLAGEHPDGRLTVDRVWQGRNFLAVIPEDPSLLPSLPMEFEASAAGIPPLRVALDRMQRAKIRAVYTDGSAVAGSTIDLIVKGTGPFQGDQMVHDPRRGNMVFSHGTTFRPHEVRSSGVTDGEGRASLFVPTGGVELMLRVTGADHPKVLVHPATVQPAQEFVVTVPQSGGIAGQVELSGFPATMMFVAAKAADTRALASSAASTEVQADGSFALRGLAPGRYRLTVMQLHHYMKENGTGDGGNVELGLDLPPVDVEGGRVTEVNIDLGPARPATLRGRMVLDGAPPQCARVVVQRDGGPRCAWLVPAADGSFEMTGLVPGAYRVALVLGDFKVSDGDLLLHDERVTLEPGQTAERAFAFTRRRLEILVLQPDGRPAAGLRCVLQGDGFFQPRTLDAEGRLVLDPAPSGPIRLSPMQPLPGPAQLLEVEMPRDRTRHTVTLRLGV